MMHRLSCQYRVALDISTCGPVLDPFGVPEDRYGERDWEVWKEVVGRIQSELQRKLKR